MALCAEPLDVLIAMMSGEPLLGLHDLLHPPAFHRDALCAEYDRSTFFPEQHESAERARAICSACLVRRECLEWAMEAGPDLHGVWGGTSRAQRRRAFVAHLTVDELLEAVDTPRDASYGDRLDRRPKS